MRLVIDISKDRYDEIMSMDWKNCRLLFDEEIRAIHDGKVLEQELCTDCISREATVKRLCQIAEIMNKKRDGLGSPYVMAALFIQDNKDEFPPVTPQPKPNIKALGEDIRICQKSITDKKVLIGFNMAVALCNKHLAESEVQE